MDLNGLYGDSVLLLTLIVWVVRHGTPGVVRLLATSDHEWDVLLLHYLAALSHELCQLASIEDGTGQPDRIRYVEVRVAQLVT